VPVPTPLRDEPLRRLESRAAREKGARNAVDAGHAGEVAGAQVPRDLDARQWLMSDSPEVMYGANSKHHNRWSADRCDGRSASTSTLRTGAER
jgi:hypothetical protein